MSSFEIIGHRGFPQIAPENTLVSFQKAIDVGVPMVECDVTLTQDGEIIVLHDNTLNRTTNGRGKAIKKTLSYARGLDAGSWFSKEYAGEKVPLLSELLSLVKGKCKLNIEIKAESVKRKASDKSIESKVVRLVREMVMEQSVIVSSFEPLAIYRVKRLDPSIRTAMLLWKAMNRTPKYYQEKYLCDDIHMNVKRATKDHVQQCLNANMPVRIYTVNDPVIARKLKEWGVQGIFTDNPKKIKEALNNFAPGK